MTRCVCFAGTAAHSKFASNPPHKVTLHTYMTHINILIWRIWNTLYGGDQTPFGGYRLGDETNIKSSETKISFKEDINRHTQASSASLAHQSTYSLVLNTNITRTTGATFSFDIHGDLSLCYTLAMQISHNLFDRGQSRSTSIKQSSSHILSAEWLRGSPLRSY